jgi:voltage-gated potassium channel
MGMAEPPAGTVAAMNRKDDRELAAEEASPILGELAPKQRRRAFARVVFRTVLTVALLITAYALIDPRDLAEGNVGARLVFALLLFFGVLTAQFFAIMRDPTPELRAGSSMIVAIALLVLIFSMTYATLAATDPDWFSGFGDITAVSETARWVVTAQMILDLTLVVALGRVLVTAARAGHARQQRNATGPDPAPGPDDATS